MKEIKLSQNQVALVDDEDYDKLVRYNWTATKHCNTYYARTQLRINGKRKPTYMHRFILELKPYKEDRKQVDHKDWNGLNNQRTNLRIATQSQQNINRRKHNKTGYRGVHQISTVLFRFAIREHGKKRWYSGYKTAKEAAIAYDVKAKELHGPFAILNFK